VLPTCPLVHGDDRVKIARSTATTRLWMYVATAAGIAAFFMARMILSADERPFWARSPVAFAVYAATKDSARQLDGAVSVRYQESHDSGQDSVDFSLPNAQPGLRIAIRGVVVTECQEALTPVLRDGALRSSFNEVAMPIAHAGTFVVLATRPLPTPRSDPSQELNIYCEIASTAEQQDSFDTRSVSFLHVLLSDETAKAVGVARMAAVPSIVVTFSSISDVDGLAIRFGDSPPPPLVSSDARALLPGRGLVGTWRIPYLERLRDLSLLLIGSLFAIAAGALVEGLRPAVELCAAIRAHSRREAD
jgi:hypothetical protein